MRTPTAHARPTGTTPSGLRGSEQVELAAQLACTLTDLGLQHYRELDVAKLRARATGLVTAFSEALRLSDTAVFVEYVGSITEQRIAEGYHLEEMQAALGVLEEEAWRIFTRTSRAVPLLEELRQVTRTISAAKDQLARIYLTHQQSAELQAQRLRHRIGELFKGTVSAPVETDAEPVGSG